MCVCALFVRVFVRTPEPMVTTLPSEGMLPDGPCAFTSVTNFGSLIWRSGSHTLQHFALICGTPHVLCPGTGTPSFAGFRSVVFAEAAFPKESILDLI